MSVNSDRAKLTPIRFLATLILLFFTFAGFSQQVNCNGNCTDAYCKPQPNKETGCLCFDGIDNDLPADGKIDRQDLKCAQYYGLEFVGNNTGDCSLNAPSGNPFAAMAPPAVSGQNTADTQSKVTVGDLDGDNVPDVVITSKWNSEMRVVATKAHTVDGISYAPGDIKSDFKSTGQGAKIFDGTGDCDPKNLLFEHENLIANIDPNNPDVSVRKYSELFGIVSNRGGNPSTPPTCFFLVAFTYRQGDLVPMYNAVNLGTDRPGAIGIADMDGDGKAELYMRDRIYAAETGALLATGNGDWDLDITSGPVAVDVIKGDNGKMELVCGTKIYSIPNLSNRNPGTPANLTLAKDMNTIDPAAQCFVKLANDPVEYGTDTHSMCSVADMDNDGNIDVIISGALNSVSGKTAVFYWNVAKNLVSYFIVPDPAYPNGWPWGTGRINLMDVDNDKTLDLFFVAGNQLFRVKTQSSGTFDPLINTTAYAANVNTRIINDSRSGVLTVTIYDFNNDGQFELVYRDSQELVVVDAKTLSTKFWSATCQSHTYTEGPIIADVNGDGATDICVPCNRNNSFDINDPIQQQALGEVRLWYSSTNAWVPTRKVWNQPGYFVININDNLTLPFPQYDMTTIFSSGTCASNGLSGPQRPLNVYLNQLPYLSASGCPVYPAPDLTFYGDDPAQPGVDTNGDGQLKPSISVAPIVCGETTLSVTFNVVNSGLLPITASVPVAFYKGDPTLGPSQSTFLHTTVLNVTLPVGVASADISKSFIVPENVFTGVNNSFDLYIVLDNTGFPVPAPGTTQDCKLANNVQKVTVTPNPFVVTAVPVKDNTLCAPTDMLGEVKVDQITRGTTVMTDWSQYSFQWYNGPAATAGAGTIRTGATNYNLTNIAGGTYSVIAKHKTIGCQSAPTEVVIGNTDLTIDFSMVKDSDQTKCSPFNGGISLNFFGADLTGVSIVWRDISGNVIANDVTSVTGLQGGIGSYTASVSRGGCTPVTKSLPLNGPAYPTGTAFTKQDVMSCLNPQSGIVSATLTGIDTDPTHHRFTWYNNANGVRGSAIPNQPASGVPDATDLAKGFYEVVITNILTNCVSRDPIAPTEVKEGFTMPTVDFALGKPNTSCDPNIGNGALQAVAFENGVPAANQGNYHYYWYAGQNTITKLRNNANAIIDNSLLEDVQGGVKSGGQAYTVQIEDKVTGCSATNFTTALEDINYPVVSLTPANNDVCVNTAGIAFTGGITSAVTFDANPVTNFTNYTFSWYNSGVVGGTPVSSAQQLAAIAGGTYTLQVEETVLKCKSAPVTVQILDLTTNPVLAPSVTGSTNCTTPPTPDGKAAVATIDGITVPASGVLSPYTFQWHTGVSATAGSIISGETVGFLDELAGSNDAAIANYTVRVQNNKGCSSILTIHIPDNRVIPTLTLAPVNNQNCAVGNGVEFTGGVNAIITNQIGALTDYTFTWSEATMGTVVDDDKLEKIAAGTYSLVVKHTVSGCESPVAVATVTNQAILPVVVGIGNGSTNCAPNKPGNGSASLVSVDAIPAATATGYSYQWFAGSTATGTVIATSVSTPQNIQGATNAYYTVKVRKLSNNCENTATVQVPDLSALPIPTLSQTPNTNCEAPFDGSAMVNTNAITYKGAPYTTLANIKYDWFVGTGTGTPVSPALDNATLGQVEDGFYSATVTMINEGCTSNFVAVEVLDGKVYPVITTALNGSTNCVGGTPDGSANVTGIVPAGTYEHRWYAGSTVGTPGSEINTGLTDTDISGLQGGPSAFYTIAVKNSTTRCTSTEVVLIPDIKTLPVIVQLTAADDPNCDALPNGTLVTPGGSVTLTTLTYQGVQVAAPYTGFTFAWTGTGAPAPGANIPVLADKPSGVYSLQVTHNSSNCISDIVSETIVDAQVYPAVTNAITAQTSCDPANPNGKIVPTITGAGTNVAAWFAGIGAIGSPLAMEPDNSIIDKASGDYTIRVHNATTGCTTIETVLLPNNITIPVLTYSSISPVQRCDTPDGSVTTSIAGTSNPQNFTWFHVFTPAGGTTPFDPAVIKGGTAVNGSSIGNQAPLNQLSPGFVTALVRDNNTACESNPNTAQIINNTDPASITFDAKVEAGFCDSGTPTGELRVTVTSTNPIVSTEWFAGSPTNTTPIDFMQHANLPTFTGGVIQATEDLIGVNTGVYTLVVFDNKGCGDYYIDNVPFIGAPVVTITPVDNTTCDPNALNGSIRVQVSGPATYQVTIHNGNSATLPALADQITFDITKNNLGKGQYYIQVTDQTPANILCPLGYGETLDQTAFGPLLALGQVDPNTACDGSAAGEGKVFLTANQDSDDTTTPDYEISAINPGIGSLTVPFDITEGASQEINGFRSDTYVITVRDKVTICENSISVTIPDQPLIPQSITVGVTNDEYCAPLTSGRLDVTAVSPGAVGDYVYEWYDASMVLIPTNTTSSLTNSKINPVAGQGNGANSYYVRGIKNTGIGQGCPTTLEMRTINDVHVVPVPAFTSTPNTSCAPSVGEGSATLSATTASATAAIQNATYSYIFDVVNNYNTQAAAVAITDLTGKAYPVQVTNDVNKCVINSSVTVIDAQFSFAITNNTHVDQLICDPFGEIVVTEITLDRSLTGQSAQIFNGALTTDFDFEWTASGSAAPLEDSGNTPINDESLLTGTGASQYPAMGSGTYFVTATRKITGSPGAGCKTPPLRVDVADKHLNPVVALTPAANTSCDTDPANAEGSIKINVTDATAAFGPYTYEYTWTSGTVAMAFPNVNDGNGVTNSDNDNPVDLIDGLYSIDVRNMQTGCIVSASTTVTRNETPVIVAEATSDPQEFCSNSGAIEVTLVQVIEDGAPGTAPREDFTYTWERNGAVILTTTGFVVDINNYPDISAGSYFVTAQRTANPSSDGGPGYLCKSAPYRIDIEDKINYPNVTVVPSANTACTDDENFFEGSAEFDITEAGPGSGASYEYTWTSTDATNLSPVLDPLNPKPTGDGVNDVQAGLRDDTYQIAVRNLTTDCIVNTGTAIVKTTIPIIIAKAGTTPKLICDPDGTAFVSEVLAGTVSFFPADMANFDFTWSEGDLGNTLAIPAQGTAILNNTTYPTITDNSLIYYVSVKMRDNAVNPDLTPAIGKGCSSAPVMVEILDQSRNPEVAFAITQNTSCNDLDPDGSIVATASDPDGLAHTYAFSWTWSGGTLPAATTPTGNGVDVNGFNSAPEGTYTLVMENNETGCTITREQPVILDRNISLPNILEVLPTPGLDCNGSGLATVTQVYIGNDSGNPLAGNLPRFVYTWYTAYTDAANNTPIPAQQNAVLPNLDPGRYFVTVMDTQDNRNCESGPNEVEIDDPIENYPIVQIQQSLPQISCRPNEGTAALTANARENETDPGNTGAPYVFSWYTGTDAADGNELLDLTNAQRTGFLVNDIIDGAYSVRVLNTTTNCLTSQYYIIQDDRTLFYPTISVSNAGRTRCDVANGGIEVRENGFANLNTSDPTQSNYYPYAPNFSAHAVPGPMATAPADFVNPMTPGAGFDQTVNRVWTSSNLDALEIYTVKVIDENTGCPVISEVQVPDLRQNPVLDLLVVNPLINCYSAQPNGQILAVADQRPASEYTWEWYPGQVTVDPSIPSTLTNPTKNSNLLIGVGAAESADLFFTVYAVNNITHCPAQGSIQLLDSRVPGQAPEAYTVQDDDRCDTDNGWVTAHVLNETFTHNFYWFDGTLTDIKDEGELASADGLEADYRDLKANTYTVYAQDKVTGCVSLPITTPVADITVIPELIFKTTASYCEDVPTNQGGGIGNGTIELTLDPADLVSESVVWTKEADLSSAGTGNYVTGLYPGWYAVEVMTTKGCTKDGRVEVPTDIRNYNLITQNQDNKNDAFIIDCISRFPNNNVKVFNRSGILVYNADGYDNLSVVFDGYGKNGLYMAGNMLPVGTYFYIIDKGDGSKPRTGYLELVR